MRLYVQHENNLTIACNSRSTYRREPHLFIGITPEDYKTIGERHSSFCASKVRKVKPGAKPISGWKQGTIKKSQIISNNNPSKFNYRRDMCISDAALSIIVDASALGRMKMVQRLFYVRTVTKS